MSNPFDKFDPDTDRDYVFWGMRQLFSISGDPLAPMRAVVRAAEIGEPPPTWVIEYLAERFSRYIEQDDPRPLDKIMGLAGFTGQAPALKEERRKEWVWECINKMWELHIALGVTVVEASKHVERWALHHPRRKKHGLEVFSANTLRYKYYHGYKKSLEEGAEEAFGLDQVIQWTKDHKEELAQEFGITLM